MENLYRLRQVDKNGNFAYSRMITLKWTATYPIAAAPNPMRNGRFSIRTAPRQLRKTGFCAYWMRSVNSCSSKPSRLKHTRWELLVPGHWPAGLYLLQLEGSTPLRLIKTDSLNDPACRR